MRRINIVPTEHGIKFIEDSEGDHVEYSDAQAEIAEKDKRIAELEAELDDQIEKASACSATADQAIDLFEKRASEIEMLTTENERLREAFEDWLNFSIDVYTSDFPGMEWLINLQKKTSELIAQAAIERGKQ